MLLIRCPWCGERDETEFHYGGQAHVAYPPDPDELDDAAWGEYLFVRDNPKGRFAERWCHSLGCRRWFNAVRDTATHAMVGTYAIGDEPPGGHEPDPPEPADPPSGPRPDPFGPADPPSEPEPDPSGPDQHPTERDQPDLSGQDRSRER